MTVRKASHLWHVIRYGTAEKAEAEPDELSMQPDDVELWYVAKDVFINGVHCNNFEIEHPLYVLGGDSGQLFFALDDTIASSVDSKVYRVRDIREISRYMTAVHLESIDNEVEVEEEAEG